MNGFYSTANVKKPVMNAGCAGNSKDLSLREGPAPYQLVGEVMAHQGYDG